MWAYARPTASPRQAQFLGHLADIEHRSVAHVSGDRRQRVADNPFADDRASAVGGDKRRALDVAFLGLNLTLDPSCSNPVTRALVRSSMSSGRALQPSSSEPWMSARCVTA